MATGQRLAHLTLTLFSMMLAREANIIVQDSTFAGALRADICASIKEGAHQISAQEWLQGNKIKRFFSWLVYGAVRLLLGVIGIAKEQ